MGKGANGGFLAEERNKLLKAHRVRVVTVDFLAGRFILCKTTPTFKQRLPYFPNGFHISPGKHRVASVVRCFLIARC